MSEPLPGLLSPPMENGEVIFEAPWQGRVFGMAHTLAGSGVIEWDEFRACLIAELARWDREGTGPFEYYDHFLRALETLLLRRGLVSDTELSVRRAEAAARPHGHDHSHDHSHDHNAPHGGHGHSSA